MADSPTALTHGRPVPGRLGMLAGVSLLVGFIPLPLVPGRVVRQLRGAIIHDVASRHGISLTAEARGALAASSAQDKMRMMLRTGVEMLARRVLKRLGPLAPLSTIATSFEVYALGHLLERYFRNVRPRGTVRMQAPEAERVRKAIDTSVLRAFYPSTEPGKLLLTEGVEDLRDEFTRWMDSVLLTGATLPSYIERRLDAAFDEVIEQTPELHD